MFPIESGFLWIFFVCFGGENVNGLIVEGLGMDWQNKEIMEEGSGELVCLLPFHPLEIPGRDHFSENASCFQKLRGGSLSMGAWERVGQYLCVLANLWPARVYKADMKPQRVEKKA